MCVACSHTLVLAMDNRGLEWEGFAWPSEKLYTCYIPLSFIDLLHRCCHVHLWIVSSRQIFLLQQRRQWWSRWDSSTSSPPRRRTQRRRRRAGRTAAQRRAPAGAQAGTPPTPPPLPTGQCGRLLMLQCHGALVVDDMWIYTDWCLRLFQHNYERRNDHHAKHVFFPNHLFQT